jgi:hypothetical protein
MKDMANRCRHAVSSTAAGAAAWAIASLAAADTVVLVPDKDNTLIQTTDGSLSHGASPEFYSGKVGPNGDGTIRRGVIHFDVAGMVPAGSIITSAQLKLRMNLTQSGNQTIRLKKMLEDWGEGASEAFGGGGAPAEPGDATWLHRFWPDVFWSTTGGKFSTVISAQKAVGDSGIYLFGSTAQMVADVQEWIDTPTVNFGWVVQGNETSLKSVKQFGSREAVRPDWIPNLTIVYTPPLLGDLDYNHLVDGADLGMLLANWGENGTTADLDFSGVVDGGDLGLLLAQWTG